MDSDIKNAFIKLIKETGSTTNKDVKEYLRGENFYAIQSRIKDYIDENYENIGLTKYYNGSYNVFSILSCDDDCDCSAGISSDDACCGKCCGANCSCSHDDDSDDDSDHDSDDDDFFDDDDDTDDIADDDGLLDNSVVVKIKVFSQRQLKFTKDSNVELKSKLRNPKYLKYKTSIENILKKRATN